MRPDHGAIEGAIKDTFRRNKFAEQTRDGLDNIIEFPASAGLWTKIYQQLLKDDEVKADSLCC